ncbi:HlyD family secretion protein [Rhizobium leguminosarum]|uniref:HlyD family secretion protein n=1 Tax=Rhizobium leguminosarum TaxID=384 RepID=UPI001C987359|nr:HlyD family secretion protein [Rhizobium leguminosarum]MBY5567122.1 HlyD family secretion protein [Rhizobium leguminosarum]MBY5574400.1 HlyD family secretion protein [Rhizobium leguminosarum]
MSDNVTTLSPTSAKAPPSPVSPLPPSQPSLIARLFIPATAVILAVAGVAYANAHWNGWTASATTQTTDDAAVGADFSTMSARVSGNIRTIAVDDYQPVKKGDLIVEIDPSEYDAALALATANLEAAKASRVNLGNQENLQRAVIKASEAQNASALAVEEQTRLEFERQKNLGQASTEQRLQQAQASFLQAQASVASTAAAIEQQRAQLQVLQGQEPLLNAQIDAQEANFTTAQLHQRYSRIYAPFDGVVGKKSVHLGDYVGIGGSIVAIVPIPNVYVTANFKETQLSRMSTGQLVDVRIDTFPGKILQGRVGKLSPASGSTFALLPPDNATGNYTKVVQRVPVRIEFISGQPLVRSLRPGMSAVVTVSTPDTNP